MGFYILLVIFLGLAIGKLHDWLVTNSPKMEECDECGRPYWEGSEMYILRCDWVFPIVGKCCKDELEKREFEFESVFTV